MTIFYTYSTLSHLHYSYTLYNSLQHNYKKEEFKFVLFIVSEDINNSINYSLLVESGIILEFVNFEILYNKYPEFSIEVFNNYFDKLMSLKPILSLYIMDLYHEISNFVYFDSDIYVFKKLDLNFANNIFFLTPHLLDNFKFDNYQPSENKIIASGLFNAGFFAFQSNIYTKNIFIWWANKLKYFCLIDPKEGLYVDQIWLNQFPILFDNVEILKIPGMNVAYWNLNEREVISREEIIFKNNKFPIYFIHYSGFDHKNIAFKNYYQNRIKIQENENLFKLMAEIAQGINQNEKLFVFKVDENTQQKSSGLKSRLRLFLSRIK